MNVSESGHARLYGLNQLRQYGHLAWILPWWSDGQFQHFRRLCDALGLPLGGWHRQHCAPLRPGSG